MSVAQSTLAYYESDDFKENYAFCLLEDRDAVTDRIITLVRQGYEVEKEYGSNIYLEQEQALEIYEYILENMEEFMRDFGGGYVGYTSIDSIGFGEQEEQLTGIYNHETGGEYTLEEMQKDFEENGFYVSGEYAYYDMSYDGVHIDLLGAEIPMLKAWIDAKIKAQEEKE